MRKCAKNTLQHIATRLCAMNCMQKCVLCACPQKNLCMCTKKTQTHTYWITHIHTHTHTHTLIHTHTRVHTHTWTHETHRHTLYLSHTHKWTHTHTHTHTHKSMHAPTNEILLQMKKFSSELEFSNRIFWRNLFFLLEGAESYNNLCDIAKLISLTCPVFQTFRRFATRTPTHIYTHTPPTYLDTRAHLHTHTHIHKHTNSLTHMYLRRQTMLSGLI